LLYVSGNSNIKARDAKRITAAEIKYEENSRKPLDMLYNKRV
jgi:hypothetical protein